MGTKEKTTEFLKDCMADALIRLMQKKPVEKISAGEIAEEAGVGRATWFRHFESKQSALTYKLVKLWMCYAESHDIKEHSRYSIENARDFFEFNYGIRDLFETIYAAGMRAAVYEAFYEIMRPQYGATVDECYTSRFYSYGLFGLLDEWISRGYYETPEEMTALFLRTIAAKQEG